MSIYADALPELKPGEVAQLEVDGVTFAARTTDETGVHSGRRRYRVTCRACGALVHDSTTGPRSWAASHVREWHS